MFGYDEPFAHPVSSFNEPVPPTLLDPDEGTLVQVRFSYEWLPYVVGAIMQLTLQSTWDTSDPDEVFLQQSRAQNLMNMFGNYQDFEVADTPYWDTDTDVDDNAISTLQTWYGFVTDPLAPPGELDFVESFAIWLFTGFVMFSGGVGAAVAFKTQAPRFYIFVRDTNIVELVRIVVDGVLVAEVETPGANSGEIRVPVIADPEVESDHQLYVYSAALGEEAVAALRGGG